MEIQKILVKNISSCNGIYPETQTVTVKDAFDDIMSDRSKNAVLFIRKAHENKFIKKSLKSFVFAGEFSRRDNDCLVNYSNICVLDFDDLEDDLKNEMLSICESMPQIFAYWVSPGGNGVKALVYFDFSNIPDFELDIPGWHTVAYGQIRNEFLNKYPEYEKNFDGSGCDVSRLCFTSWDPNLKIKEQFEPFVVTNISIPVKETRKRSQKKKYFELKEIERIEYPRNNNARRKIASIIKFLKNQNKSITRDYFEWFKVGQIIANTFPYKLGKKYYLSLCRLDGPKHSEMESRKKLIECYENTFDYDGIKIGFATLIKLAEQEGWK